jgi:dTMP kinase
MNPKFIVIEGGEGAGKSTAVFAIMSWLEKQGVTDALAVREPGGTPMAESIRDLIKSLRSDEVVTSETELLLMYAARSQLVQNVIKPALDQGRWVICDRFYWSTFAYQGGGRGIDNAIIESIHQATLGDFSPDFTIYMDIDPLVGMQRAQKRGELDRFEQQQADFFQRVQTAYQTLVEKNKNTWVIDAGLPLDKVTETIVERLNTLLV